MTIAIRCCSAEREHSAIALVFTGTLLDNIRLGRAGATEAEVETAARQAALGEVIDRSPQGMQQHLDHQGAALSGGERQRVARALLKSTPILILDEATSALYETTERTVAAHIRTLPSTVILVTHRDADIWQPCQYISFIPDLSMGTP